MSSPMEVTLQSATSETAVEVCKQTEVVLESSTSPIHPAMFADDKVLISVEVCLKPSSTARADDVRKAVERPVVHVFQLSEDGPVEELSGGDMLSSFNEWNLLAKEFDGMWESLMYETGVKQRLLRYTASALLFTEKGVDPCLVS